MKWISDERKSYIVEKTEQEATTLAEKLLQQEKIKSYGKPERIISHRDRRTGEIFYKYQIECKEVL
jgi:vacuolar-type H+-ATPase subunit H